MAMPILASSLCPGINITQTQCSSASQFKSAQHLLTVSLKLIISEPSALMAAWLSENIIMPTGGMSMLRTVFTAAYIAETSA